MLLKQRRNTSSVRARRQLYGKANQTVMRDIGSQGRLSLAFFVPRSTGTDFAAFPGWQERKERKELSRLLLQLFET